MTVTAAVPLLGDTLRGNCQQALGLAHIFRCYGAVAGLAVASAWAAALCVVLAIVCTTGVLASFTCLGPNSDASFGGVAIDDWGKWTALMLYSATSQLAQSVVAGTLDPLITNEIRDPRSPFPSYAAAQVIITVQNVFLWMVGLFDILLYITMQLQFWVPAIIADLVVNAILVDVSMKAKRTLLCSGEATAELEGP